METLLKYPIASYPNAQYISCKVCGKKFVSSHYLAKHKEGYHSYNSKSSFPTKKSNILNLENELNDFKLEFEKVIIFFYSIIPNL